MSKRVLLIDDDGEYCEMLGDKLGGRFDFVCVNSVSKGIEAMDKLHPDAVLLDLKLPDSEQVPLHTLMRVKEHRKNAAIVILSINSDPQTMTDLIHGNADAYWVKGLHDTDGLALAIEINKAIAGRTICDTLKTAINKNTTQ
jgi:Response regulator containing CheY-like receiver, AAA-type ATPase, and DNA-binding domains